MADAKSPCGLHENACSAGFTKRVVSNSSAFLNFLFLFARMAGDFAWPEGAFSCPAERQGPTGPRKVRRTRRGKASRREATRLPWVATRRPAARRLSWSRASAPPRTQAPRLARRSLPSHQKIFSLSPLYLSSQAHEPPENTGRNALFAPPRAPQKKFTYPLARPRKIW